MYRTWIPITLALIGLNFSTTTNQSCVRSNNKKYWFVATFPFFQILYWEYMSYTKSVHGIKCPAHVYVVESFRWSRSRNTYYGYIEIWNYDICVSHPPTFDICPNYFFEGFLEVFQNLINETIKDCFLNVKTRHFLAAW